MTRMNMMNTDNAIKILLNHNYQRHLRSIVFNGGVAIGSYISNHHSAANATTGSSPAALRAGR